jgi:hypothetical protein
MSESIDQTARDDAHNALSKLATHEAVCAERYLGIQKSFQAGTLRMQELGEGQKVIMRLLAWGGALTITVMLGVGGWMAAKLAEIALK